MYHEREVALAFDIKILNISLTMLRIFAHQLLANLKDDCLYLLIQSTYCIVNSLYFLCYPLRSSYNTRPDIETNISKMAVHPPKKPDLNVLPKIRPRALTLPLPLAQEAATKKKWTLPKLGSKFKQTAQDQITFEQEGCTIFTKLPREIRDMIWKECLGGSVLHFGFPDGKGRGYVACQNRVKPKNTSQLEEWASGNGCLISCWDGEGMTHGGSERHLLGLPLTCRRM